MNQVQRIAATILQATNASMFGDEAAYDRKVQKFLDAFSDKLDDIFSEAEAQAYKIGGDARAPGYPKETTRDHPIQHTSQ